MLSLRKVTSFQTQEKKKKICSESRCLGMGLENPC